MQFETQHDAHLYIAGLGKADLDVILQSAAITAMVFALASAIAALIISNKKKK